jgi:DnaJ homolog subfamily A member 2
MEVIAESDLYKILNITKTASLSEIQKAHRKLAGLFHPDKYQNKSNEEKIIAKKNYEIIADAYAILSDEFKRIEYNKTSKKTTIDINIHSPEKYHFEKIIKTDIPDIITQLDITIEQLYNGDMIKHNVKRMNLCDKCNGNGTSHVNGICYECKGQGSYITEINTDTINTLKCKQCNGTGINQKYKCIKCKGTCCIEEIITLNTVIKPGSTTIKPIIMKERGHQIPKNQETTNHRTNIIIMLNELQHTIFQHEILLPGRSEIDSSDLMMEIHLTFSESLCGFTKCIKHLDDRQLYFSVHHPVRHNDILVVKNEGMPYINNKNKKGDLFIVMSVEHPNTLSLSYKTKNILQNILNYKKNEMNMTSFNKVNTITFDEYLDDTKMRTELEKLKKQYTKIADNDF